jgi:hypothetical protein
MAEEYRVEMYDGKLRRLYRKQCEQCGADMWRPKYYSRRFCSPQCAVDYTRRGWLGIDQNKEKHCGKCGAIKNRDEFRANKNRYDGRQAWCKVCESENKSRYYRANMAKVKKRSARNRYALLEQQRRLIYGYLIAHPCVDCGENDILILDFDHVTGLKETNVATMANGKTALKRIEAEIMKCVIRCANCHRRKTARERGNWKSKINGSYNSPVECRAENAEAVGSIPT